MAEPAHDLQGPANGDDMAQKLTWWCNACTLVPASRT